jgi:hypothetical protein
MMNLKGEEVAVEGVVRATRCVRSVVIMVEFQVSVLACSYVVVLWKTEEQVSLVSWVSLGRGIGYSVLALGASGGRGEGTGFDIVGFW